MASDAPRLPAVQPLTTLLPSGTEGGKEFARIVGLLLFQDARRQGREFNLFDDASGDYEGLDSFSRPAKGEKIIGFQYKFFHRLSRIDIVQKSKPQSNALRQELKKLN